MQQGKLNSLEGISYLENGRGEWIRTIGPLHPMQVRYRAAPRPDSTPSIAGGIRRFKQERSRVAGQSASACLH